MLTSFVLSMALAAPVPPPAPPVASGPAPRILELKANADGKVTVTVARTELMTVNVGGAVAGRPGAAPPAPPAPATREIPVTKMVVVELSEVKDLKITTADGKKIETEDAVKKIAGGAVVVVSADGKPVSPNFLKVFKDDVLVLTAPELAAVPGVGPRPAPGGRPIPAPAPPIAVPGQPGVVQIQIAPIPVVPAQPAPPAPKP